ncbi:hypothetical protein EC957_011900 [Mortierella hygrophila]|uniref:Uncharacterized protein n=1 Tax=Mortierella hygrophila TaxID=979708 RepID=A0A9P6F8Q4_9FUNG|nr:hypothetical protein EC957_011900 [Mortierella hygrophila]
MGADWYDFVSMTAAAIPVPKEALQQPFKLRGFKLMTFMHEHYDDELEEHHNEYHGAMICLAGTELLLSSVEVIGPYNIEEHKASCKRMKHLDAFMPAGTRERLVNAFEKYTGRKPDVVPGFWAQLPDDESRGLVDTLITPSAVEMLHKRLAGRLRPIVTAIEGILETASKMLPSTRLRLCLHIGRIVSAKEICVESSTKSPKHPKFFASCPSIKEALWLFLCRHHILDAPSTVLENDVHLVEAAFGRIKPVFVETFKG